MHETLYHGTSEALAAKILTEGIWPGATNPCANPANVYLSVNEGAALAFGYVRVMGTVRNGYVDLRPYVRKQRKNYDRIAVFDIETTALDQDLLQESDHHSGIYEFMYPGVVPVSALLRVTLVEASKSLEDFAATVFHPERVESLLGKQIRFDSVVRELSSNGGALMNPETEKKVIAALLTVALNTMRPRAESKQLGKDDWSHVWEDYKKFQVEIGKVP